METPAENRQERIEFLKRQEERKRNLPAFLDFMSQTAGWPITENDALSISDTDDIWKKIDGNEKFQQASFSISFPYRDKDKLLTVFQALQSTLTGQKHYFATFKFFRNFFLFIDTSFCIDNYEKIVEFDSDGFCIYDSNISNCLWIDTNEEHWRDIEEYTWTFELKVSGLDWMDKIYKAYIDVDH